MSSPADVMTPNPAAAAARPGRPLIHSHRVVLQGAGRAQVRLTRAVCGPEIVNALGPEECALVVGAGGPARLVPAVQKIVDQLIHRRYLDVVGRVGAHRYVVVVDSSGSGAAGEWSLPAAPHPQAPRPMPSTHRVVLTTLEVANLAEGRASTVGEVIAALTPDDMAQLEAAYPGDVLTNVVAKILTLLVARGAVTSPGVLGRHRFYVAEGALAPGRAGELPDLASRRARILDLTRAAAVALGRAVRIDDIVARADALPGGNPWPREAIVQSVGSLVATGDLVVVGQVRGGSGAGGAALYLPCDLDPAAFRVLEPLTRIGLIAEVVCVLWREEELRAAGAGRRPQPFLTRAIRERLAEMADDQLESPVEVAACATSSPPTHTPSGSALVPDAHDAATPLRIPDALRADVRSYLEQPALLTNALELLAEGADPVVRRVTTAVAHHAHLWAPAAVPDDALDLGAAYVSDSARAAEAVRRACAVEGTPAVTVLSVDKVVASDPALRPASETTLARVLADAAREQVHDRVTGERRARARPAVVWAGRVDGRAYYVAPAGLPGTPARARAVAEACGYVSLIKQQAEWRALDAPARTRAARESSLPTAGLGRALLVAAQCEDLGARTAALSAQLSLREDDADAARDLDAQATNAARQARVEADALRTRAAAHVRARPHPDRGRADAAMAALSALPGVVERSMATWTARELVEGLRAIAPSAEDGRAERLPFFAPRIGRVPNPGFVARSAGGDASWEEVFDRTDALLHAARTWGGPHALLYAALAETAVERLRDVRFVAPGLDDGDHAVRLAAVASLAFLRPPAYVPRLADVARTDPEPGIRAAAAWAYGFAGGEDAVELCRTLRNDPHPTPRAFAAGVAAEVPADWWRM